MECSPYSQTDGLYRTVNFGGQRAFAKPNKNLESGVDLNHVRRSTNHHRNFHKMLQAQGGRLKTAKVCYS